MIKQSLFTLCCIGIFLASGASLAWAASLNEVIRALETPFQTRTEQELRINDYSADFFQESKIASLDRMQRANGRVEVAFNYQRTQKVPDVKFRWQYDQPTTQEIVSDGETLWVYLPENNQVIQSNIQQVNQASQNDPMTFLTGLGNLSRDFQISWAVPNYDADGNYVLELTPRRISSLMNKLIIVVDRYAVEAYLKRGQQNAAPNDPMLTPPNLPGAQFAFPDLTGQQTGLWFPIMSTTVYDPNGNSTIIEFSNLRVNLGLSPMTFNFMMPAGVQVVKPTGKEMGF